jgi:hypothetical protein
MGIRTEELTIDQLKSLIDQLTDEVRLRNQGVMKPIYVVRDGDMDYRFKDSLAAKDELFNAAFDEDITDTCERYQITSFVDWVFEADYKLAPETETIHWM